MRRLANSDLTIIAFAFFIWRITLFLIAFLASQIIPVFGAKFPYYNERLISSGLPNFVWSFGNFDGVHYIGIAKDSYSYQFTQAFFPLYPLLVKLISTVTHLDALISALILSNIAFLAGLVIFYKIVFTIFDRKTAIWSSLFLLTFPTSFYFGAVYTEGLFFFLTMLSLYFFTKQKLVLASFIGLSASATRLIGIYITALLQNHKKINVIPLMVVPLGLIAYMFYLKVEFNNAFYFFTSQSAFGQERSTTHVILLPQVIYRSIKQIATTNGLVLFNSLIDLFAILFCLIILAIAYKKINKEWVVFSLLAILTPTLTGSLASMPRYILIAFPMYIVLAQIRSTRQKLIIILGSMSLGIVLVGLFTRGYWVA